MFTTLFDPFLVTFDKKIGSYCMNDKKNVQALENGYSTENWSKSNFLRPKNHVFE